MCVRRFAVALLLLLAGAASADVLHLQDGTRVTRTVTFCDEEVCVGDKRRIERDTR